MPNNPSSATYQIFVNALPDAAMVVDHNQLVIAANVAARDMLSANLDGQPIALFLRSPEVLQALAQCLADADRRQIELAVPTKIQRTLDVHIASLGQTAIGKRALVLLRDRTREAQVERMRSDFVANASHELRTPLTTLSGFIETMQGAAHNDENARSTFLQLMKAQAERMSSLIDDLLSLSRIELDEHVVPNAVVNLADVAKQAAQLLQALVQKSNGVLTA